MIPVAFIEHWRQHAPWPQSHQVEQDLVISRALVELFGDPFLRARLVFRGGTALYKLHLTAARYSEDIDLVQSVPEPIGPTLSAVRALLDAWLGEPKREFSEGRVTLTYRFLAQEEPVVRLRLKIEINTREQFSVFGLEERPFSVRSPWYSGEAAIATYSLDEMMGTKLRALYQRKKGRDLFDLWDALARGNINPERVLFAFQQYMAREGHKVRRSEFERNLEQKLGDPRYLSDVGPLLAAHTRWEPDEAMAVVREQLIGALS